MVYKNKRRTSKAAFIALSVDILIEIFTMVRAMPKSYQKMIGEHLYNLANDIHTNCVKSNKIYVNKSMTEKEYELRQRYLDIAITSNEALSQKLNFLILLRKRNFNILDNKTREEADKMIQRITEKTYDLSKQLKGIKSSDKKRWKYYQEQLEEESKKAEEGNKESQEESSEKDSKENSKEELKESSESDFDF